MDPVTIIGWQRIAPDLTTSGRLKEGDVRRLAELGVRSVINLAPPDHAEALRDEAGQFARMGLDYTSIPVPFDAPQEDHYLRFCTILKQAQRPVHLHCIANWRVSAFLYRYHLENGMAERAARKLMREQWLPDATDHPDAQPWAEFVRRARQDNAQPEFHPAPSTAKGQRT